MKFARFGLVGSYCPIMFVRRIKHCHTVPIVINSVVVRPILRHEGGHSIPTPSLFSLTPSKYPMISVYSYVPQWNPMTEDQQMKQKNGSRFL